MSSKLTNNTLSNIKLTNNDVQNTTQKTLRNTKPNKKTGVNSGAPEGKIISCSTNDAHRITLTIHSVQFHIDN